MEKSFILQVLNTLPEINVSASNGGFFMPLIIRKRGVTCASNGIYILRYCI